MVFRPHNPLQRRLLLARVEFSQQPISRTQQPRKEASAPTCHEIQYLTLCKRGSNSELAKGINNGPSKASLAQLWSSQITIAQSKCLGVEVYIHRLPDLSYHLLGRLSASC